MEDVKWLLRKCGLPILLLLIFVIAGVVCWGELHTEKQKVAEEVWEPPVEIENSEAETEEAENAETSTESAYWFIPQASDDLLTEEEKEQLQSTVLSAAESVREIYKDIVIADALSYANKKTIEEAIAKKYGLPQNPLQQPVKRPMQEQDKPLCNISKTMKGVEKSYD